MATKGAKKGTRIKWSGNRIRRGERKKMKEKHRDKEKGK